MNAFPSSCAGVSNTTAAEDDAIEAAALVDAAEVDLENAIRDIDADLGKLDRQQPDLNARATVFPDGYGKEIDPEGEEQLTELPALRKRIAAFAAHGGIADTLARFDTCVETFKNAITAEDAASTKVDELFQRELDARREIREQLESAYGRLRDFYKARPALAEDFFLKEGSRKAAKKPTPEPKG